MTLRHRGAGLALGVALDQLLADPQRHHPVAWFGSWATLVEKVAYADSRAAGALFTAAAIAPALAGGIVVEKAASRRGWLQVAATAAATWAALGVRRLANEGGIMADRLDSGDLEAAREQLPNLCGRDPRTLDEEGLGRATVESMAENTNDAGVCTLLWGAVAGVPGILAHRALNTLDAMVGYRNERYGRFGTVAAVADDAAAWLPARVTGALACLTAPLIGGRTGTAWRIMRRDGASHPSPNGGWCESAWAGALGVQLGGENRYGERVESRPTLGDGPRPRGAEVRRAAQLVTAVTAAATAVFAGALILFGGRK
ncbi:cobalamin biosynthesis protein [Arachnia rubra]|jgi:cobalamin biosynthesis protein cobD|uniref:Cobalamin biosynthesis protein CobD n=1 Tax=Arachnia rubra TaxID=1547448 RepID=A0ABX7Y361_9ACTN|nr:cobalamin biosynthesis protein [Arachnia rubra]MDO4644870.1 cobalamin biosynthesis protein [Propionibacteriaceae bacterium]QUC07213.1 cobalamin biosynthesis protein [Arachnia rubra]BCR81478.1 cobalamin biosynthesis protein CobD [Arachnia rubra]